MCCSTSCHHRNTGCDQISLLVFSSASLSILHGITFCSIFSNDTLGKSHRWRLTRTLQIHSKMKVCEWKYSLQVILYSFLYQKTLLHKRDLDCACLEFFQPQRLQQAKVPSVKHCLWGESPQCSLQTKNKTMSLCYIIYCKTVETEHQNTPQAELGEMCEEHFYILCFFFRLPVSYSCRLSLKRLSE